MKKILNFLSVGLILIHAKIVVFAEEGGIFGEFTDNANEKLKKGEISTDDIPNMFLGAINFLMGIAGTVAIIFVIIGAYQILFGSLQQDKTKGKETIIMALGGFALAALSWFIVRAVLDNLSGTL
ncbi:pilin [Candidatus Gracilibacteria bacterium]|nr:pilin [Candidatus Gracilibacteria bacterium]